MKPYVQNAVDHLEDERIARYLLRRSGVSEPSCETDDLGGSFAASDPAPAQDDRPVLSPADVVLTDMATWLRRIAILAVLVLAIVGADRVLNG